MKKIFTLVTLAGACSFSFAQSQRLVLVEEFTQASCGPCASQNPAFNALLGSNTTKAISLKYQTSWPGVDPMNAQNPSQVATRVSYYNVSGVPHGVTDGTAIANDCSAYVGAPACMSQTDIDNEYAVPSPFDIVLSHTMSADYDSIYITCTITASQAVSTTQANGMKAHIALVEREINFTTPPGTNGETEFFNVMRKMLPSDQGTTLPDSWTVGQTQTITIGAPVPSYIYDLNQLGVVAFVQDNANKAVHQAAVSLPQQLAVDASIASMSLPLLQCNTTFTPSVTLKNYGSTTLTAVDIEYQVDAGPVNVYNWTGSLASGATTTVTLPSVTTTSGSHTFTVNSDSPNSMVDYNGANDSKTGSFSIVGTSMVSPVVEGYQSTTFPPANWTLNNPDGAATWSRKTGATAGGFGNSTAAAKMDFYNSPSGEIDELYLPPIDLTGSFTAAKLDFNVAYAPYNSSYYDAMHIMASTDCGTTWTTVWSKSNTVLATTSAYSNGSFSPSASQWRAESVDLSAFLGQSQVIIKFQGESGYGNNAYVDDINIYTGFTGIEESYELTNVSIQPNPFNTEANMTFMLLQDKDVKVDIYNVVGERVSSIDKGTMSAGQHTIAISANEMPAGIYFVQLTVGNKSVMKKVTVTK